MSKYVLSYDEEVIAEFDCIEDARKELMAFVEAEIQDNPDAISHTKLEALRTSDNMEFLWEASDIELYDGITSYSLVEE